MNSQKAQSQVEASGQPWVVSIFFSLCCSSFFFFSLGTFILFIYFSSVQPVSTLLLHRRRDVADLLLLHLWNVRILSVLPVSD